MVQLEDLKGAVLILGLIALVAGGLSIALTELGTQTDNSASITTNNESVSFTNDTLTALNNGGRTLICNSAYNDSAQLVIIGAANYTCTTAGINLTAEGININANFFLNYTYQESSAAQNQTDNGLVGIDNSTSFLGVIGTIIGVMVLVGIVVGAFMFGKK